MTISKELHYWLTQEKWSIWQASVIISGANLPILELKLPITEKDDHTIDIFIQDPKLPITEKDNHRIDILRSEINFGFLEFLFNWPNSEVQKAKDVCSKIFHFFKSISSDGETKLTPLEYLKYAKRTSLIKNNPLALIVLQIKNFESISNRQFIDLIDNYKEEIQTSRKMRNSQRHEERTKALAEFKWQKDPNITTAQMACDDDIASIGCENITYNIKTIEKWIRSLNPNPRPGRPKKNK